MNLQDIVKNVRSEAKKLTSGPDQLKVFGEELARVADRIEKHWREGQRPVDAESIKGVDIGSARHRPTAKFKPRKL